MVYETETLKLCHDLTDKGEIEYHKLLESYADMILFQNKYPIFTFILKIMEIFNLKIKLIDKLFNYLMNKIKNGQY